jgi:hypothetical protein
MAQQDTLVRLTGLWKSESKTGTHYLAGSLSASSKLLILPNTHKKQASDPDYIAYLTPPDKKEKGKETEPERAKQDGGWL